MEKQGKEFNDIKGFIRRAEGVLEALVLSLVYYYIWQIFYQHDFSPAYFGRGKYVLIGVYFILILAFFSFCEGFKFGHLKLADIYISQVIALAVVNFVTYLQISLIANKVAIVGPVFLIMAIDMVMAFVCCWCFTAYYHSKSVPRNMLLIYGTENAIDLKFKMDTRKDRYTVTELVRYDEGMDVLKEKMGQHDSVIINDVPAEIRNDILKYCYHNEIRTYVVPKISDIIIKGSPEITLFDTPLLLVKGRGLSREQELIKRLLDLLLCAIAFMPFVVISLITAIAIKLDDGGPVFYTQERLTKNGKLFKIYKFRSMKVNSETAENYQGAVEDDPRITRVGHIIRRFRIDELAQYINILKGDMSFVGCRPEHLKDTKERCQEIPDYMERYKAKAGLTGYAQVYGKYNTSAYDKLRMDLMYVENYSLILDIKLILMTIRTLFRKDSTEGVDMAKKRQEERQELMNMEKECRGSMDKK